MAQTFDAPSKAILRSQIAEHIAETDMDIECNGTVHLTVIPGKVKTIKL